MGRPSFQDFKPTMTDSQRVVPFQNTGAFLALAQAAVVHGVRVTAAELAREASVGARAPNAEDIVRTAIAMGLRARIVSSPSVQRLRSLPTPAVFATTDGKWALLASGTDTDSHVVIHATSRRREVLTTEELAAKVDGEVVIIGKGAELAAEQARFGLSWFIPALKRYRAPLTQVLVASFFINLLGLARPLTFQLVIDKVLVSKSYDTLTVVISAMVLLVFFEGLLKFLRAYILNHTASRIDVELGAKLFAHLVHLSMSFFERRAAGVIVSRAREIEAIRRFLTDQGLLSAIDLLFVFVFFAVLFIYSHYLCLIFLLFIPVYFAIALGVRPLLRKKAKDKMLRRAKSQQLLVESIVGMQTIKASAVEAEFQSKWDDRLSAYIRSNFESAVWGVGMQTAIEFTNNVSTAAILFFGTMEVIAGRMTVGGLIAFNLIAMRVTQPILRVAQLYQSLQEVRVSVEHLADILDAPREEKSEVTVNSQDFNGAIEFRAVTFRYLQVGPDVLKSVDLYVRPGETIGIVGPSGSGKSTIAKLLQRFYSPSSGSIEVDGVDIARIDPGWLRQQLGIVLQENFLFNLTIHENIALAQPRLPREQVIRVARLSGAHEFIAKMPSGYDTVIEERGANLSGGQRQRIAIARALATNPRVLIFDEATSALDYESEQIIRENMARIARGRTVIIIAHRLSAVRNCDRIVGLVDGEVTQIGTHEELLMQRDGIYFRLWNLQTKQAIE